MKHVVKLLNFGMGIGVIGWMAYQMFYVLAYGEPPNYQGLGWAAGMTALLLMGTFIQLLRFVGKVFDRRGQVFLSLALFLAGVALEVWVALSVLFGWTIPHLTPIAVFVGYWAAYYGEIVVVSIMEMRAPNGLLHSSYESDADKVRRLEKALLSAQSFRANHAALSPTNGHGAAQELAVSSVGKGESLSTLWSASGSERLGSSSEVS